MKCGAPVIPAWTQRIKVEPLGRTRISVWGFGRSSSPILSAPITVPVEIFSPSSKKPIHLEFANCRSENELIAYVQKYGPIEGRLKSKQRNHERREITGKEDVLVFQDLGVLDREQKIFRCAVRLLSLLQREVIEPSMMAEVIGQLGRLYPATTKIERKQGPKFRLMSMAFTLSEVSRPSKLVGPNKKGRLEVDELRRRHILPKIGSNGGEIQRNAHLRATFRNLLSAGHGALCVLFNRFPLELQPCAEGAIELPKYEAESILPILYFLLRRDYKDKHYLIKMCPVCSHSFKPQRGDSRTCGRKCQKRYNDRERYLRDKSKA